MQRLRQLLIGVACAALFITAGCTDDSSGASTDPSPSASSSGEPSPSEPTTEPTPTWTPPPAQKPPKGGWPEDKPATEITAEKVVRLWIDAYSRAISTGDTSRMRAMSRPECRQCKWFAREVLEDYRNGVVVTTKGDIAFVAGALTDVSQESASTIKLRLMVKAPGGTRAEPGANPVNFKAETYEWFFLMVVAGGQWKVKDMGFVG